MYHSMVDAVGRVEASIEDVKAPSETATRGMYPNQHYRASHFQLLNDGQDEWEAERREVVQDLLRQDAEWEYVYICLLVALSLLTKTL